MKHTSSLYTSVLYLLVAVGGLLTIPLIAMQFENGVNWTLSDFIFAFVLLFGTGFVYLFITRNSSALAYKVATASALGTGFFLVWSNLAVGIIGSEDNVFNLSYFLVIVVGLTAAVFVRFKVKAMMWVLFGLAILQALITAVAIIGGFYVTPPSTVIEIIAVNGFFIFLWCFSGLLYRYADGEHGQTEASQSQ